MLYYGGIFFYLLGFDGNVGFIEKFFNFFGDYEFYVWVFSDWRRKNIRCISKKVYLLYICIYCIYVYFINFDFI